MQRIVQSFALAALGASLAAAPAAAQASGFVIGGGSTFGLNNNLRNGPNVLVGYQFVPRGFPLGVRIEGTGHLVSYDRLNLGVAAFDAKERILNGNVNFILNFATAGTLKPYLIGGGGVYNLKTVDVRNTTGILPPGLRDSDTRFGVNAGAGFDLALNSTVALFAEARFHRVFVPGSDLSLLPITVGAKIGSF